MASTSSTESQSRDSRKNASSRKMPSPPTNSRLPVPIVLLAVFLLGTAAVIVGGKGTDGYRIAAALIWGFGFCVSGMLLGFLFAIPRVLPAGTIVTPSPPEEGADTAAKPAPTQAAAVSPAFGGQSEINSNLVEVSDWLTKIIVGVGLVELKNLPAKAESVAFFVAPSLGYPAGQGAPVVGGIMLFYSVHGFLIGYLLTRIDLAMILKWADNQVLSQIPKIELQDGKSLEMNEMVSQLQDRLGDVQKAVGGLMAAAPKVMEVAGVASAAVAPTKGKAYILWVDDILNNTASLVDSIKGPNVVVHLALSTNEALHYLTSTRTKYDLVITDMYRREGEEKVPNAGVILTQFIKEDVPELPVLVYCSISDDENFGTAASYAGARLVTTSSTRLLGEVTKVLQEAGKA